MKFSKIQKELYFYKIKKISLGYDRDSNNPIEGLECIDTITVASFLTNNKGYAFKCLCFIDFFKLNFVFFSLQTFQLLGYFFSIFCFGVWHVLIPVDMATQVYAGTQVCKGMCICTCMNVRAKYQ